MGISDLLPLIVRVCEGEVLLVMVSRVSTFRFEVVVGTILLRVPI
jgi:hypothetical protein